MPILLNCQAMIRRILASQAGLRMRIVDRRHLYDTMVFI